MPGRLTFRQRPAAYFQKDFLKHGRISHSASSEPTMSFDKFVQAGQEQAKSIESTFIERGKNIDEANSLELSHNATRRR